MVPQVLKLVGENLGRIFRRASGRSPGSVVAVIALDVVPSLHFLETKAEVTTILLKRGESQKRLGCISLL